MKWIKVIFINFLVLFMLLIVSEIGIRLAWTLRSCINNTCDFSRITNLRVRTIPNAASIGLSQYDAKLGYIPRPNFSGILNFPELGYYSVVVNIDERSFRKNNLLGLTQKPQILAVGDSLTFGDQVSDVETWPSCLQKKLGKGVVNAGVFGYGAAQALSEQKTNLKLIHMS